MNRINVIDAIKYTLTTIISIFYIVIIFVGVTNSYKPALFGGPITELFVLLGVLILLACNEGLQVGILEIQRRNVSYIEEMGYRRAAAIHKLMFPLSGSRLKHLLIGQSFCVVFSSFIIANLTTFSKFPDIDGVSPLIMDIFIRSGLPGAFITICCAQLLPSILAKEYPLDFLNIIGVYSIVRFALFVEEIGIVQFVYLLVQFVEYLWDLKLSSSNTTSQVNLRREKEHQKLDQNEAKEIVLDQTIENEDMGLLSDTANTNASGFFYLIGKLKYVFSTILSIFCFTFVIFCMLKGYSSSNKTVLAQFSVAICALFIIFYCEGAKIAIISTLQLEKTSEILKSYPGASKVHALLNERPEGVKRFLLGRQLIVVPLGFLVAQITNFGNFPRDHISDGVFVCLISLGLPGMLILLQFSQLTPQLVAEANGLRFLSKRGVYTLAYIALFIEKLGLTSFSWVLYAVIEGIFCKKRNDQSIIMDKIDNPMLAGIQETTVPRTPHSVTGGIMNDPKSEVDSPGLSPLVYAV